MRIREKASGSEVDRGPKKGGRRKDSVEDRESIIEEKNSDT